MFGFKFIKAQPTDYLIHYRGGKILREGAGLSFFYYSPTSSLVSIPLAGTDVPFIFEEKTSDFQSVTIQGQVTYRVAEPKKLAGLMNFTLGPGARSYASEDPLKLPQRVIHSAHVLARGIVEKLTLRDAIRASDSIVSAVKKDLSTRPEMASLGLEVLGLSILAVRPSPETSRALEAETREQLLKEADQAVYARRNAAVEQERAIKENELNTEIAVENKRRQIREAQMDAERAVQEKQHLLRQDEVRSQISLEEEKRKLAVLTAENSRIEADSKAYGLGATLKAFGSVDSRVLQALAISGMKPEQLIASAFQELAGKAEKIQQLNISPDLLRELLDSKKAR